VVRLQIRLFTLLLLIGGLLVLSMPVLSADVEEKSKADAFVDLDGDGLDDANADDNDNGIPDKFEASQKSAEPAVSGSLGDIFNRGELAAFSAEDILSKYAGFCKRQFRTRDLAVHRGGFNSGEGFGPGNGIGIGAVSAGCVGPGCQGP
jgi:hypothetical protein